MNPRKTLLIASILLMLLLFAVDPSTAMDDPGATIDRGAQKGDTTLYD
jgi:hypothetical protein